MISERVDVFFAGPDADRLIERADEDLAVADLAGAGGGDDRIHNRRHEFGRDRETGEICLADEVLTSDSSRYWDAAEYNAGNRGISFDKQIVRNWLLANWDKQGTPPRLPDAIVEQTAARYRELIDLLTN